MNSHHFIVEEGFDKRQRPYWKLRPVFYFMGKATLGQTLGSIYDQDLANDIVNLLNASLRESSNA